MMHTFSKLKTLIGGIDITEISENRKQTLQPLIDFIQQKVDAKLPVRINFICTHNSRRSHLAQIWSQTMAYHFGISNVFCYSGGTEVTAVFPMVIKTLENTGFQVEKLTDGNNPVYSIKYAENEPSVIGFSKKMTAGFNPQTAFAAVMTCSHADKGCPVITGAEKRIPVTYDDPKAFDNTPQQMQKYQERSEQIAREMYYVFSKITS